MSATPLTAEAARAELDRRLAEASDDRLLDIATLVGVAQSVRFDKARQVVEIACEEEVNRRRATHPRLAEQYDALQTELDAVAELDIEQA